MKVVLQDNSNFILRFDKSEDVIVGLEKFMADENIEAFTFSAIGAAGEVEIGFYSIGRQYIKHNFAEDLEVTSLLGNGGELNGKPVIHAHGTFGKSDLSVIGGHVLKLIVSVTCEVSVLVLKGHLDRANNSEFNLNLLV